MLEDVLIPGLDIVFVGTAAGRRSSEVRNYYAGTGNRFWETLHEVGLTDRRFQPSQFRELATLRMGFTDLCKTQAGMDHQIHEWDLTGFERKIRTVSPRAVAFTSKKAASVWLSRPTSQIQYGRQAPSVDGFPEIFVQTLRRAPQESTGRTSLGRSCVGGWRNDRGRAKMNAAPALPTCSRE